MTTWSNHQIFSGISTPTRPWLRGGESWEILSYQSWRLWQGGFGNTPIWATSPWSISASTFAWSSRRDRDRYEYLPTIKRPRRDEDNRTLSRWIWQYLMLQDACLFAQIWIPCERFRSWSCSQKSKGRIYVYETHQACNLHCCQWADLVYGAFICLGWKRLSQTDNLQWESIPYHAKFGPSTSLPQADGRICHALGRSDMYQSGRCSGKEPAGDPDGEDISSRL